MITTPGTAMLGVVVIARNEQSHIATCLDAVLAAIEPLDGVPVVLVDSGSTDGTVGVASRYPIRICRYGGPVHTAAAGRRIGFENINARYVLFLDGDCRVEPKWVVPALERMQADSGLGIVYGNRCEIFEEGNGVENYGPDAAEYGLGGNAMISAAAMRDAGGFNPYLTGEEEAELAARIERCGYSILRTPELMMTHFTARKSSVGEFGRRLRGGLIYGTGQVLRRSLSTGMFRHHALRFNRYLLTLAYLLLGALSVGIAVWSRRPWLPVGWLTVGLAAFLALAARRGSVGSAVYIVSDWVVVAWGLVRGFVSAPGAPEDFAPPIDWIQ